MSSFNSPNKPGRKEFFLAPLMRKLHSVPRARRTTSDPSHVGLSPSHRPPARFPSPPPGPWRVPSRPRRIHFPAPGRPSAGKGRGRSRGARRASTTACSPLSVYPTATAGRTRSREGPSAATAVAGPRAGPSRAESAAATRRYCVPALHPRGPGSPASQGCVARAWSQQRSRPPRR